MLSDRCLSVCPNCLSVTLVYCGKTVGWIKVKLGMQVGLGPGRIVSDGDQAPPPQKGAQQPSLFGPCLLWPNGWMDQDATLCEGSLDPGHIVLDGNSAPPLQKGHIPNFRPMSIVAKRSPISSTAEHL